MRDSVCIPFSTALTADAGNWSLYGLVASPIGTTRIRSAFVFFSIVFDANDEKEREAVASEELLLALYWKLTVALNAAAYASVVAEGANADPGTTNFRSAGPSFTGATEYVATVGYVVTGVGVPPIPLASVVPAPVTVIVPPVICIDAVVLAHEGRLKYMRTSVSLPRTSRAYEPRPWLTVESRSWSCVRSHELGGAPEPAETSIVSATRTPMSPPQNKRVSRSISPLPSSTTPESTSVRAGFKRKNRFF